MSISKAAKAAYDRRRYLRLGPRSQQRDRAAKAAYDRARYAARYVDKRPSICAAPLCENVLTQPKRGVRLYCGVRCAWNTWWHAHYGRRDRTYDQLPLPMSYVGHGVFDEARRVTGLTGDSDYVNDILGAVVLALIEGKDPHVAHRAARAFASGFERATVHIDDINQVGYRPDGSVSLGWQEAA